MSTKIIMLKSVSEGLSPKNSKILFVSFTNLIISFMSTTNLTALKGIYVTDPKEKKLHTFGWKRTKEKGHFRVLLISGILNLQTKKE